MCLGGGNLSLVRTEAGVFEHVPDETHVSYRSRGFVVNYPPEAREQRPLRDCTNGTRHSRESLANRSACKRAAEVAARPESEAGVAARQERTRLTNDACEALAHKGSERHRKKLRERQRPKKKKNVPKRAKNKMPRDREMRAAPPDHGENKKHKRKCRKCSRQLPIGLFSASQLRNAFRRLCRTCVRRA